MALVVSAATDVGLKRQENQDHFAFWPPAPDGSPGTLMVVADGMGGAKAGDVASRIAVECVVKSHPEQQGDTVDSLRQAVEDANHRIHEEASANPDMHGMGTTCTVAVVRGDHAWFAHVGDSRAYLVRNGEIRQLTQDHSLVAQLVQQRHLTPEQARSDRRRNVVTRSVGVWPEVEVDVLALDEPLQRGDTVLLCSDGLHGVAEDDEIAALASLDPLGEACRSLIALAMERGAPDNVTVVLGRQQ